MPGELRAPPVIFGRQELVKALAVLLSGSLFGLNCFLSQGFPRSFLPFIGQSEMAFVWAAPAGILMGVGYSLLGRALKGDKPGSAGYRPAILLIGGFLLTIFFLVVSPSETAQFYLLLFFLFPCGILVYGAMSGRLWAVVLGALLQLLIGLGTSLDGRNFAGLLAYAIVFVLALELSYSCAAMTLTLERETAEAADARVRLRAKKTLELAAGHYLWRLPACLTGAGLLVALALAIHGSPGLFGPAYADSFEAPTVAGLLLPGVGILSALALGLLVPHDAPARIRTLLARARLLARTLFVPVRPVPEEEELETF